MRARSQGLHGRVGKTDGAFIPRGLQTVVGDPFDRDILRAAIIHDHYVYPEREGVRRQVTAGLECRCRDSGGFVSERRYRL